MEGWCRHPGHHFLDVGMYAGWLFFERTLKMIFLPLHLFHYIWPLMWKRTLLLSVQVLKNCLFAVCHPFWMDGMVFEQIGSSVQKKILVVRTAAIRLKKILICSNGWGYPFGKSPHLLAYGTYFAKQNEMVLCEMVLCEMVLCEVVLCEVVLCET